MTSEREQQLEFARKIALRLLEARSRSEAELRSKLAAKNVPADIADELIHRFREVGLVDDAAFATALVTTRVTVDRRGRGRIRQELRAKGIDEGLAAEALAQLSVEDETEAAMAFAQRRLRTLNHVDPFVARRRLYQALARRGFRPAVIQQVVDQCLDDQVDWPDLP